MGYYDAYDTLKSLICSGRSGSIKKKKHAAESELPIQSKTTAEKPSSIKIISKKDLHKLNAKIISPNQSQKMEKQSLKVISSADFHKLTAKRHRNEIYTDKPDTPDENNRRKTQKSTTVKMSIETIESIDLTKFEQHNSTITNVKKVNTVSVSTQTNLSKQNFDMYEINGQYLQHEIAALKQQIYDSDITIYYFEGKHKLTRFYTGISKYEVLRHLYGQIRNHISCPERTTKLTKFKIFFLTLSHLRLALSFRHFAYKFGVSEQTVSRQFHRCLHILYSSLKTLVYWPQREQIIETMPLLFKNIFGDKICMIINCFEIFSEKNAPAQIESFSNQPITTKYLIGITPQGTISFISKGYEAKSSDKFVIEDCGILNRLDNGDVILTKGGFSIEDDDTSRSEASLKHPQAFTKFENEFHQLVIAETKELDYL